MPGAGGQSQGANRKGAICSTRLLRCSFGALDAAPRELLASETHLTPSKRSRVGISIGAVSARSG
eukprot:5839572-Pyramimonas_sp.AAC.1